MFRGEQVIVSTQHRREAIVPTGIDGLDEILRGGLPARNVYLVQGAPGTGKTTLALQFLQAGVAKGERVVYVALGETLSELETVARSHGWSLEGIDVCDLHGSEQVAPEAQYTFFHPSEIELGATTKTIMSWIDRVAPKRVVLDSLSEMRLLARDSLRYRRQVLALKHHMTARGCTVLLLDTTSHPAPEFQLETVAHGVLTLEQKAPAYGGKRRRLAFEKVRGVSFRDGWHDYLIATGGLRVFPRLVAGSTDHDSSEGTISSGDPGLDALLGGGVERGTSTLLVGPSGVGKSTIAMQFVREARARGERAAIYLFDESRAAWHMRSRALDLGLHDVDTEALVVQSINPSELSPGEFADRVRTEVASGVRLVVIDSVNGYNESMPEERFSSLHMHELLSFLGHAGVTTILVLATIGSASGPAQTTVDLSYISDTIIALRYFEAFGEVRKAISVLKKRTGAHEATIRELEIRQGSGIRIGEKLHEFRGVLTGAPEYTGARQDLLGTDGERDS